MPSYLRKRETSGTLPVLQIGVREFQDAVVVWAGPTLRDAQYMVVLERFLGLLKRRNGGPFFYDKMVGEENLDLRFHVLPKTNAVGQVLADGGLSHLWGHVAPGLQILHRCTNVTGYRVSDTRDMRPFMSIRLSRSAWQALVSHLNPTAEIICDANGANQQFRVQVEHFIRQCESHYSRPVSDAEIARCLAWKMRSGDEDRLFGIFEHDDETSPIAENGTIAIGAF